MMEIKNLEEEYMQEACQLAINEYIVACSKNNQLIHSNFEKEIRQLICFLFHKGRGKVAVEDGRLVGYLTFMGPWEGHFGKVKGVYSPLGGSAFKGGDRGQLASRLFEIVSGEMVKEEIFSYAITTYSTDEEIGASFVMNGFGIRCSDAMMNLSMRDRSILLDDELIFKEAQPEDYDAIGALRKGLVKHLSQAPTFFPTNIEMFNHLPLEKNKEYFVVKDGERVIGYLLISEEGETYIGGRDEIAHINGLYVLPEYRQKGIAQQLLEYGIRYVEESGRKYLGVDYETLNPTAQRFWTKYFKSYTYSYVRRIDERIKGYEEYLEKTWNSR